MLIRSPSRSSTVVPFPGADATSSPPPARPRALAHAGEAEAGRRALRVEAAPVVGDPQNGRRAVAVQLTATRAARACWAMFDSPSCTTR